jgi:hypothetical protein
MRNLEMGNTESTSILSATRMYSLAQKEARDTTGVALLTSDPNIIRLECMPVSVIEKLGTVERFAEYLASLVIADAYPQQTATALELSAELGSRLNTWYTKNRTFVRDHLKPQQNFENADQIFWEVCTYTLTEIPQTYSSETVDPRSPLAQQMFELWAFDREGLSLDSDLPAHLNEFRPSEGFDIYFFLMQHFIQAHVGHRFCMTSKGEVAIMPREVQTGDLVVHIRGGYIPAVFRKSGIKQRRAELVGFCFVHGMDDIYQGSEWEDWELE